MDELCHNQYILDQPFDLCMLEFEGGLVFQLRDKQGEIKKANARRIEMKKQYSKEDRDSKYFANTD